MTNHDLPELRELHEADCKIIHEAFQKQGWQKPVSIYKKYLEEQKSRSRDVILAYWLGDFAGYVTILWKSGYPPFKSNGIPEISDLNVLKKYQRRGIATALMEEAENRIRIRSSYAGIGFGVTHDYGPAQIMYVKRHYIPDGNGIMVGTKPIKYGDLIHVQDNVVFWLIKSL